MLVLGSQAQGQAAGSVQGVKRFSTELPARGERTLEELALDQAGAREGGRGQAGEGEETQIRR